MSETTKKQHLMINLGFTAIVAAVILLTLYINFISSASAQRTPKSMSELITELPETHWANKGGIIRDIARHGDEGKIAGPIIKQLLSDEHWDLRVTAARALGYIGYHDAIPELIDLLDEQHDWRLVYVSILSLGQLLSHEALDKLDQLSLNHWYSPVRDAATISIIMIKRNDKLESKYPPMFRFYSEFADYTLVGNDLPVCDAGHYANIKDSSDTKLYRSFFPEEVAKLNYSSPYEDFDHDEKTGEYTPNGNIIYEDKYPDVALKIDDGWFTGIDRGEWGGELAYIDSEGNAYPILRRDNIYDLHATNVGLVALSGMNHMLSHYGFIMKLAKDDGGAWIAQKYMSLPGAPRSSWKTENGELLINTYGGSVILTHDGELEMASCDPMYSNHCNEMMEKLLWIEKANAQVDALKAFNEGNYKYMAITGYAYVVPGLEGTDQLRALREGFTYIEGTSDAICTERHMRLNQIALEYAAEYNKLILRMRNNDRE